MSPPGPRPDRISAFDHVLATPVPGKGRVLSRLSAFWFERTRGIVPNHLLTAEVDQMPATLRAHDAVLRDRAMLVRRARRLDAPLPGVALALPD